jgi:hypothetical protein
MNENCDKAFLKGFCTALQAVEVIITESVDDDDFIPPLVDKIPLAKHLIELHRQNVGEEYWQSLQGDVALSLLMSFCVNEEPKLKEGTND